MKCEKGRRNSANCEEKERNFKNTSSLVKCPEKEKI
jgi:hypothetical protein